MLWAVGAAGTTATAAAGVAISHAHVRMLPISKLPTTIPEKSTPKWCGRVQWTVEEVLYRIPLTACHGARRHMPPGVLGLTLSLSRSLSPDVPLSRR